MSDSFSSRQLYWAGELETATATANQWQHDNVLLSWGDSVSIVMSNVAQLVDKARLALQNPQRFQTVAQFDETLKAYVSGIYLQIREKAPRWSDPIRETANDLAQGAKELAKPVGFGAGAALVVIGALYLLSRKL